LVCQITQLPHLFDSTREVKHDIGKLYSDLVGLVGSISVYYRQRMYGVEAGHTSIIKFDAVFGRDIDGIWKTKVALYERMWQQTISKNTYAISLRDLRYKLNPDTELFRDELYSELAEDLERAEDTCEWVKNGLVEFFRGRERILTITGEAGTGKTVLADWIQERLQWPLNRVTYGVLLYTFRKFPSVQRQGMMANTRKLGTTPSKKRHLHF
jgi:hypothetical protein